MFDFFKKSFWEKTLFMLALFVLFVQESFAQTRFNARAKTLQQTLPQQPQEQKAEKQAAQKKYPPGYFLSKKVNVIVNYDEGKVRYRYRNKVLEHPQASGLTYARPYYGMSVSYAPDTGMEITLNLGFSPFLVDISTKNPMNTCGFDMTLKHELTHVALYRSVMERYIKVVAAALKVRYLEGWKDGKKLAEVRKDLSETFDTSMKKYLEDAEQQNQLLDGDEHYSYQWKQCTG